MTVEEATQEYNRMRNENVVQKIWGLCHILRGDGIGYHQYVSELTYLLFLKMAEENGAERLLPEHYRWRDLVNHVDRGLLEFYQEMLTFLGNHAESDTIKAIYAFPTTVFSHAENLRAVIDGIARIEWRDVGGDRFGQVYEGLVEKSSQDVRSGAGQYFTPRALVNAIVRVTNPLIGEVIQDPASGSGGFLIAADRHIRFNSDSNSYSRYPPRYQGAEIEKNTRRICLMNALLHGLDAKIILGDALTDDAAALDTANVILANPPFGNKAGSRRKLRSDLPFPNANKQLAFLQHIYMTLAKGGRAAVILPDNVLFEGGVGKSVRADLMKRCNLHTILRLPQGIFSSAGVKTNVLFFCRPSEAKGTENVWIYDMRTGMPGFGKTTPLEEKYFVDFESRFGDPYGQGDRRAGGSDDRFKRFSRSEISERDDNLDIFWLQNEGVQGEEDNALEVITASIFSSLRSAIGEIEAVAEELAELNEERS